MEYKKCNSELAKILADALFCSDEQAKQIATAGVVLVATSDFTSTVARFCGPNGVRRVMNFFRTHLGYYSHAGVSTNKVPDTIDTSDLCLRLVNSMADGSVSGVQIEFVWDSFNAAYAVVESKVTTVSGTLSRNVQSREWLSKNL